MTAAVNHPSRNWGRSSSWYVIAFFTCCVFYFKFLPTDFLVTADGNKQVKFLLWAGMVFTCIVIVTINIKRKRFLLIAPLGLGAILLLALWTVLRTAVDPPVFNYGQAVSLVVLCPLFAMFGMQAARNKDAFITTLWALSVVYFLAAIFTYLDGGLPQDSSGAHVILPVWFWKDAHYQNTTLFMAIFVLVGWFHVAPRRQSVLANIAISIAALIATQFLPHLAGRAAIVGVVMALAAYWVMSIFFDNRKADTSESLPVRTWRPAVVSVFLILSLFNPMDVSRQNMVYEGSEAPLIFYRMGVITDEIASSMSFGGDDLEVDPSDASGLSTQGSQGSQRLNMYKTALQEWTSSPASFVFGDGPQTFPHKYGKTDDGWHPHNFVLELLCEYGLIGGVIILVPLGAFAGRSWTFLLSRKTDFDLVQRTATVIAVLFIVVNSFTGSVASLWLLIFILFACMPLSENEAERLARIASSQSNGSGTAKDTIK